MQNETFIKNFYFLVLITCLLSIHYFLFPQFAFFYQTQFPSIFFFFFFFFVIFKFWYLYALPNSEIFSDDWISYRLRNRKLSLLLYIVSLFSIPVLIFLFDRLQEPSFVPRTFKYFFWGFSIIAMITEIAILYRLHQLPFSMLSKKKAVRLDPSFDPLGKFYFGNMEDEKAESAKSEKKPEKNKAYLLHIFSKIFLILLFNAIFHLHLMNANADENLFLLSFMILFISIHTFIFIPAAIYTAIEYFLSALSFTFIFVIFLN